MMTDREALFRAVLDYPDDDTPRLIFADFLEEDDDPDRAAFIRGQVALARAPRYDPVWVQARCHDKHLITGEPWRDELPDLPAGLRWQPDPFRRGFPAAVRADTGYAFAAHADDLFALAPVEELEVPMVRAQEPDLSESPWLERVVRLALPEGMSRIAAGWVLNSPRLDRLTDLHVGSGLTPPGAAGVIVGSRAFARLSAFSCRDDSLSHAVVNALTRLADPPRLERLDLSSNRVTADPLGRLLASPAVAGVDALDLSDNPLRADGLRALAAARLPALRTLRLVRTGPDTDGVRALAGSPVLGGLRSLSLAVNNLGHRAAAALAAAPHAANLRVLDLGQNRVGADGAAALAASPHLRNLIQLDLAENLIEDAGADALAESPHLGGLLALDVSANLFSPAAAARLRRRFADRVVI
jgi:uncharacterized protein (TIGR02996 family)